MGAQTIIYLLPLLSVVAAAMALSLLLVSRRYGPGLRLPVAIILLAMGWTCGYALEIVSAELESKLFWASLKFPFISLLPVAWVAYAMNISGIDIARRRYLFGFLLVIPVLIQPVIWTNDQHHWFWREIGINDVGTLQLLDLTYGPAFWLFDFYSVGLVAVGCILFLFSNVARQEFSRFQRVILIAVPALPVAANVIYTTRGGLVPTLDLTPFAFPASAVLLGIGLVHRRLESPQHQAGPDPSLNSTTLALRRAGESGEDTQDFDAAAEAMWSLNRRGEVMSVNDAARRLLGCERDEVIGNNWFETFVQDNDRDEARDRFERQMAEETTQEFGGVSVVKTNTGQSRYVRYKESILADNGGTPSGILAVAEDLTELLHVERHQQRSTNMESLGRLSGGVAHDFNNLLLVIRGNAELLQRTDDMQDELVASIIESVDRGALLSRSLLAFAQRQLLRPSPTSMDLVIHDVVDILNRTLPSDIRIETESAVVECIALVDRAHLEIALLNLAFNASDAMTGGGLLTIGCSVRDVEEAEAGRYENAGSGRYVRLSVSDNGRGIPVDAVERIFEPFYTSKDFGKGSGLGLSMVLGFVQQSGGFVAVDSVIDDGTTFSLYLPHAGPAQGSDQ